MFDCLDIDGFVRVCVFLRFTPAEIAFLTEYAKTMSPVAKAVSRLQGEANVQLGWLVPTITLLKSKLHNLHTTSKYCGPLVNALLAGLERRFGEMLAEPELIAAAILVPKFRTRWTTDEGILKCGMCCITFFLFNIMLFLICLTP